MIGLLHRLAAQPLIYNCLQNLAGQKVNLNKLSSHTKTLPPCTVVDVGGGTGVAGNLWPPGSRYICLDIEMPKLERFRSRNPNGFALLSDATRMSIAAESVDAVLCMCFTHHLSDEMVDRTVTEVLRVLRVGGTFILLDAVHDDQRWISRILWKLDRGSYPHSAETLRGKFTANFRVIHWEQYSIYHEYVLGVGVRK
jgi:ubiquinone/menaquinone biosynthesis C-methylase UbiE